MRIREVKGHLVKALRVILSYLGWAQYGPGEMDPKTYRYGKAVAICVLPKKEIDQICRDLRETTGLRVDWHYVAGRGIIKALGDTERVVRLLPLREGLSVCHHQ